MSRPLQRAPIGRARLEPRPSRCIGAGPVPLAGVQVHLAQHEAERWLTESSREETRLV